jgi:CheY-like chemotaxis protein
MKKLILVVEDEEAIRELLVDMIDTQDNYKATGAVSGSEALVLLTTITFDLITLDMNMPGMDGNDFLKELSKIMPSLPVIVISANPKKLKSHNQVKAVIEKPFGMVELLSTIASFA